MIRHYLSLSLKVFARRKFFTFVSLFGISFTLIVLMLASALIDHAVAPFPPEVHQDRTLGHLLRDDVGRALAAERRRRVQAARRLPAQHARRRADVDRHAIRTASSRT